jgi:hypothetical protein
MAQVILYEVHGHPFPYTHETEEHQGAIIFGPFGISYRAVFIPGIFEAQVALATLATFTVFILNFSMILFAISFSFLF